ncbi:protein CFAP20DC isoform X2 [Manacus candei]|uniref:protein CFAP20DC isoform X2 n=1 Tax=Manacus candei TaxID=415023 RepID=UPI0022270BEB|nr:protein CFAP20DC isoform X2 [Manacus candei]
MFKNHYQGGRFVEIFSAQGKNPGAKWKIFGNPSAIWKEYDKELKGFVFVLEGSSQVNKMQLPKETRQTLGLIQQFLTLQIFVPLGKDFSTELLITDLGNIKRRLYLSTVHKELSVTPLHAKIPLFMIKRKIWCNMCIDLAAFTSEIFRGAVFQSLDGIIISANCKLRKIFTLKSKPQDTAEENGSLVNRGQGNIRSSKTQDVSHIAFGSKILGPPPSSNRRVSTKVPGEKIMSFKVTKTSGSKSNRSCQLQNSGMPVESIQDIERLELSFSSCNDYLDQGGKRNTHQTTEDTCQNDPEIQTEKTSVSGEADFQLSSPQVPSPDKNSHKRLSLKNAAKTTWEITSDEWEFPGSFTENIRLDRSKQFIATEDSACHNLNSPQNASVEHHSSETGDQQVNNKEIFTFSSRPRSAPHGKSPNMSPEHYVFPLDLEPDSNRVHEKTQDNFQGTDSSKEDDNNGLIQGTGNLEISHCRQGTSDSAVFKEISLKKMLWKTEYWKNKEHSKHNLDETILPNPQSSTVRKTDSISSQSLKPIFSLSPTQSKSKFFKAIRSGSEKTERYEGVSDQLERSISKMSLKKISKENSCLTAQTCEYDWRNNNSNILSSSELQMLTSMKRQQNEELQDTGISHGLSTSQIDTCNVNISTSSHDSTATWNSLLPPPVSQEHHYQREMSPLSHSNPREWSNVFSPPINPGSQQLEEHIKSSVKQNIQGEDDFNAEEDEEGLTLLYDPCLYRYFDPNSGKYYELT